MPLVLAAVGRMTSSRSFSVLVRSGYCAVLIDFTGDWRCESALKNIWKSSATVDGIVIIPPWQFFLEEIVQWGPREGFWKQVDLCCDSGSTLMSCVILVGKSVNQTLVP